MDRIYAGVDLAAEPKKTGVAVLAVGNAVTVESLTTGSSDADILNAAQQAQKVGVDVPIGWPQPFIDLVTAHAAAQTYTLPLSDKQWRSQFIYRTTDMWAQQQFGLRPLSVSADLIAHPALRWVSIETQLRARGIGCARDGSERICEVYPAGALRQWGINNRGYKGSAEQAQGRRQEIIAALEQRFACVWNGHRELAESSDDALDAVIAALVAVHVDTGRAYGPRPELRSIARREGWLWLPCSNTT